MSIMEMSHRSAPFDALMEQVQTDLRQLMGIPSNYKTLFLQGGASLQFSMVPMNLLPPDGSADYIINGAWGQKAIKEAKKFGTARVAASSKDSNFDRLPDLPDATSMRASGERWRPWRSYASWYLWRSLEGPLMPGVALP